jgi:hypothetical protein
VFVSRVSEKQAHASQEMKKIEEKLIQLLNRHAELVLIFLLIQ